MYFSEYERSLTNVQSTGLNLSGCSLPSPDHPERNDDNYFFFAKTHRNIPVIYAGVFDGITTGNRGYLASAEAKQFLENILKSDKTEGENSSKRFLVEALQETSRQVFNNLNRQNSVDMFGYTGTTALITKFVNYRSGIRVFVCSAGDTVALHIRNRKVIWMSKTDSEYINGYKVLSNYLGIADHLTTHTDARVMIPGDIFALASDGLTDNQRKNRVAKLADIQTNNPAQVLVEDTQELFRSSPLKRLLNWRILRVNPDDVTAVLADYKKA